jgi:hypothetical protein
MKFAALLAAMVVVVQMGLGGTAKAAEGRTLREKYVGATLPPGAVFYENILSIRRSGVCRTEGSLLSAMVLARSTHVESWFPTRRNVGKVCFTGLYTPGTYKVTVRDVSGLDVGFTYLWDGDLSTQGFECKTVTLTRPPGASRLEIYLDPVPLWRGCANGVHTTFLGADYATKGEVTLTTPR